MVADDSVSKSNFNINLEQSKTEGFWELWKKIKNGAFTVDNNGKVTFNSGINPLIRDLKTILGISSNAASKIVLTVETYNEAYHAPVNKYKDDVSEHLADGDKFINISLQIGDYYITLATLPALKTIEKSFVGEVYDTYKSWVDSLKVDDNTKITVISELNLNKSLTAIKPLFPTFKEVSEDNSYQMHLVSDIRKYFVGGEIEVMKLPTDKTTFRDVYNKNSSHTIYDATQLSELFSKYNGTHAIKVSYGDGFSKIIPVFEKYHTLEEIIKIINTSTDIRNTFKDGKNTGFFLGNRLLNLIQIENVYKTLTSTEKKEYSPIIEKINSQIFKVPANTDKEKLNRALRNIFRSHEVIGDYASSEVKQLRIDFRNALIEGEDEINKLFAETSTNTDQLKTALSEAKMVYNFYKKLKELTKDKFYVSVKLDNDKNTESSQSDLKLLGLSNNPEDNLITGFIVETPKLLLDLSSILEAHKNPVVVQAVPQSAPTSVQITTPTNTKTIIPTNEVDDIDKAIDSVSNEGDIYDLADTFLKKTDWENFDAIKSKLEKVYKLLIDKNFNEILLHQFEGNYNDDGSIEINEHSINQIKAC